MDRNTAIEILRYYADGKHLEFDSRSGIVTLTTFIPGTRRGDPGLKLLEDAAIALGAEVVSSHSIDGKMPEVVRVVDGRRLAQNLKAAEIDFIGARYVQPPDIGMTL